MNTQSTLVWFRRDLRLSDHPALSYACARGGSVIPVFICDDLVDQLGCAPKWRLGLGLEALAQDIQARGNRLIFRRGQADQVLTDLIRKTGATAVCWTRAYDPQSVVRDQKIATKLQRQGIEARHFPGHLLFEPETVQTATGGFYRVYTPMWQAVKDRELPEIFPTPARLPAPKIYPDSDRLSDWQLGKSMRRGANICRPYQIVGEDAARDRFEWFADTALDSYEQDRDFPGKDATSRLSASLSLGEISVRTCWHRAQRAMLEGAHGAGHFMKELVWREFAYHLMHHTPRILTDNWRPEWDGFPWQTDETQAKVTAWKQGRTGEPFVDAAMRQMYVTGTMHNRARMIVASYLTKHLLTDWRIGQRWFADCLTDWDPASNAMGWQWVAGCGPDAAPYFRIFNPAIQLKKFDPNQTYIHRWLAEGQSDPQQTALDFFQAIPVRWNLSVTDPYPAPIMDLAQGRTRALTAYKVRKGSG